MSAISKALEKFKHYRTTEGGHKTPAIYGRSVKGGGMNIKQLVLPKHVATYSHNKSHANGDVGRKFEIKKRDKTNL